MGVAGLGESTLVVVTEDQHVAHDVDVLYGLPALAASFASQGDVEYDRHSRDIVLLYAGVDVYNDISYTRGAFVWINWRSYRV